MISYPSPAEMLRIYDLPAKKKFGQNFLVDPSILDRILNAARVREGTKVLEIGPGPGGLTTRLLSRGADVHALDMDRDVVAHLKGVFDETENFAVEQGDALGAKLFELLESPARTVVANLPYNVATEILFRLVQHTEPPARMALMFQKEVADRIVNKGCDRHFGVLALGCQVRYETRIALRLPPGAFTPRPKVSSAVVEFKLRDTPLCSPEDELALRRVTRAVFSQRRKMMRNTLSSLASNPEELLESVGMKPTARPEECDVRDMIRLTQAWIASR